MMTIDETVVNLYASISFDHGDSPSVEKLKQLFIEDGRLINNSSTQPIVYTVDSFIEAYSTQLKAGTIRQLKETEIHEITEVFGRIAHRFSTYSLYVNNQQEPLSKGINSIQLINESGVWKVTCLIWDDQKESLLIPEKYI